MSLFRQCLNFVLCVFVFIGTGCYFGKIKPLEDEKKNLQEIIPKQKEKYEQQQEHCYING